VRKRGASLTAEPFETKNANNHQHHQRRRGGLMSVSLPLLPNALPVIAAPKYIIRARNQFSGLEQYQTFHLLLSASRTTQTKQLNQARNTE